MKALRKISRNVVIPGALQTQINFVQNQHVRVLESSQFIW